MMSFRCPQGPKSVPKLMKNIPGYNHPSQDDLWVAKTIKKSLLRYQWEPQTVSKVAARTKVGDLLHFINFFRSCAETPRLTILSWGNQEGEPARHTAALPSRSQKIAFVSHLCNSGAWFVEACQFPESAAMAAQEQPGGAGQAERSASRCRQARSSQAAFFLAGLTRSTDSFAIHCWSLTSRRKTFSMSILEVQGRRHAYFYALFLTCLIESNGLEMCV